MRLNPFRRKPSPAPEIAAEAVLDDGHQVEMSLWDHLEELRNRLVWAFIALGVGTLIGALLAGNVFEYLLQPYCTVGSVADCRLQTLGPTEGVVAYFRVSLLLGAIVAVPVVTYQVLMFIVPGLTRREKRYLAATIPVVALLFAIGVLFAWFILMPPALGFLEGFQPTLFRAEWTADLYLSFVTALLFWMGVAFETPLVFFILSLLGAVRAGTLARNWRIAVVAAAVLAALITPTIDPVNMLLVMGPLLTLYALSILLVMIGQRRAAARIEAQPEGAD